MFAFHDGRGAPAARTFRPVPLGQRHRGRRLRGAEHRARAAFRRVDRATDRPMWSAPCAGWAATASGTTASACSDGPSGTSTRPRACWWNRLDGWSFEPIHWAYFVLWTAVCCLLLLSQHAGKAVRLGLLLAALAAAARSPVLRLLRPPRSSWLPSAPPPWPGTWWPPRVSRTLSRVIVYLALVVGAGLVGPMALAITPCFHADDHGGEGRLEG